MNFIDFHSVTSPNTDFGEKSTKEGFIALLIITSIITFFSFKHYSYNVNNFLFLLLIDQVISIVTCTVLFLINFNLNIPKYKNTVDGNFFANAIFFQSTKLKIYIPFLIHHIIKVISEKYFESRIKKYEKKQITAYRD